ncbi:MAG: GDP-mannose 4,6-dehydratase [Candidatus Eremiobacteraeota bacterium]|nr:GDP-mannose 4,6-dehydratase [Candidatus Eremiobacteraeota bacterium]MCW5870978.1 GDP-mannose 4,6-dehydratase [Candidatus Eremiobacteraeota bacterium]
MKTILVTGGAGFIGSNFVRYMLNKYPDYKIIVLDLLTYAGNPDNLPQEYIDPGDGQQGRLVFWYGNVTNGELVGRLVGQSDMVVHFAAESHVTRSIYDNKVFFETDVMGTQVVANAVLSHRDRIERFIHISTSEVYGTAESELMDEEHPLKPMSPYASAKAGADRLVFSYWATYQIPAVIIRPFNNYGPFQHLEKVVPRFVTACLLGEPLTVHGDGQAKRDWLFVEDHCRALDSALHSNVNKLQGEVINLGSGLSYSVLEIAEKIKAHMQSDSEIKLVGDRPGQVFRHTSSVAKAKELLKWEVSTHFDEGLDRTIQWYRDNSKWWDKTLWLRKVPIRTATGKIEFH